MKVMCYRCRAVMDESDLKSVDVREYFGDDIECLKCPNCNSSDSLKLSSSSLFEHGGTTLFVPVFDADVIEHGFERGTVRIIDHEGEIVCEIGQRWFYFETDADSLTMSAKEYMANHTLGEIAQKVADTLNDMGKDDPFTYVDELVYYANLLD